METVQILIAIHKDQTALVNTLWTVYQGVSLAVLGFVFSQEFVRRNPWALGFITISFCIFAAANQRTMVRSQELVFAAAAQLQAIAALPSTDPHLRLVLEAFPPSSVAMLQLGHYAFTIIVVSAIWVLYALSRNKTKQITNLHE